MLPSEALRAVESGLSQVGGTIQREAAWQAYGRLMLPEALRTNALVRQGFDAGWDSAMKEARATLTRAQNVTLRVEALRAEVRELETRREAALVAEGSTAYDGEE